MIDNANHTAYQDKLLGSLFEAATIESSVKAEKVPVYLDCQGTITRKSKRRDIGNIFSEKENYQKEDRTFENSLESVNILASSKNVNVTKCLKKAKIVPYALQKKSTHLANNNSAENNVERTTVTPSNTSFQIFLNDTSNHASDNRSKQSIQCEVTRNIYIRDINETIPSYACKLGNSTFFLSSKRFSSDYRNKLDVSIDKDTLRRLVNESLTSTENFPRVIEVVLALKSIGKNYEIHHPRVEL